MNSLKNKVKHAADKAKTNMKSAGKKDNDTAPRDTEGITRGDVAAGATGVSGIKVGRAEDKPGIGLQEVSGIKVEKEEQKERA